MPNAQYKFNQIVKEILLHLHYGDPIEAVQEQFEQCLQECSVVEILLTVYELKNIDDRITTKDVRTLFEVFPQLNAGLPLSQNEDVNHPGHPFQVFINENRNFESLLKEINHLLTSIENHQHIQEKEIDMLKQQMKLIGQLYSHFNRKEKLFFPVMERYGYYVPTRIMWAEDDRVRNLYKGIKSMIEKLPNLDFMYIKKSFDHFERKCKDIIFEEEAILLPILLSVFKEKDWFAIAEESEAFGYCFHEPEEKWTPKDVHVKTPRKLDNENHLPFGGGYLTVHEANHILNNLPLEITFVDKNGVFKYFNEIEKWSDMMLIRTPTSVGRNVANCHPPNSMSKVMKLIRDLKTKKRTSESMWFKKKDQYIHITYKGVFDENGEYLGILEYVQDIQPFFDLPREVKRELSKLE